MWENYGKNVNAMFDKLDKLQSNKFENKKTMEFGNTHRRTPSYITGNKTGNSLAEKVSNALQDSYGKK